MNCLKFITKRLSYDELGDQTLAVTQESSLGSECRGKGLAVVEVDRLSSVVVVYFL